MATTQEHPHTATEIADVIQRRITEMRDDLRRHEDALAVLTGGPRGAVGPPPTRSKEQAPVARRSGRPPGSKRASDEAIVAALRGGAVTATAVAKATGSSPDHALKRLHALADKKAIVREGERQKTRWIAAK